MGSFWLGSLPKTPGGTGSGWKVVVFRKGLGSIGLVAPGCGFLRKFRGFGGSGPRGGGFFSRAF